NDEPNILGTRIEPRSNKESPEVEITKEKEVEITKEQEVEIIKATPAVDITNVIIPVNVTDEDEEITDEVYELKRREKRKIGRYGYLFAHLRARFMPRKSFDTLADNLHDVMVETLHTMVDKHIKKQVMKQVPEQVRNQVPVYVAEGLILERQKAKEETERLITKAILQEHGNIQDQILIQIKNAIANVILSHVDASVRSYMSGHILHVHPAQSQTSSIPKQQYQFYLAMKADPELQQQDIAIWLALQIKFERNTADSYASDDDEIPTKQVSQHIMEEVSLTIDEAKLRKMADEMLRQRYHIDQMKNFLKSDNVWESRKEILVSPHSRKTTPLVHSCQRDPEAPTLFLINQDLLYLKKGNSGTEKIVLSLHKFPAIIFNDDDIEE
ncbi:hypothetical protein Tco_1257903, partial [Tanacetum coccineum]